MPMVGVDILASSTQYFDINDQQKSLTSDRHVTFTFCIVINSNIWGMPRFDADIGGFIDATL